MGAIAAPFTGQVVDVSETGFRARHGSLGMTTGQEVNFELAGHSGMASAVWTRIMGAEAESGFRIVEKRSRAAGSRRQAKTKTPAPRFD